MMVHLILTITLVTLYSKKSFFTDNDIDEVDDTVDFNLHGTPDNFQPQIIKCVQAFDGSVF